MTIRKLILGATFLGMAASSSVFGQDSDQQNAWTSEILGTAASRSLMTSGHTDSDGFFLTDGDGDFTLRVNGQLQFRYVANFTNSDNDYQYGEARSSALVDNPDYTGGFETRRTKFGFSGNVKSFDYKIVTAFDADGEFSLQDAWVAHDLDGMNVRFGQFKLPFMREENVSSGKQLAAERSVVNEIFNQDRSQGVQLTLGGDDALRFVVAFSDGFDTDNTEYDSSRESDYAFTGRVDFLQSGNWGQFEDFSSQRGDDFGLLIGGAAHYQEGGETGGTEDAQLFTYTADVSVDSNGLSLFASGVWRLEEEFGEKFEDYGLVGQAGFMLTDTDEIFGRWDSVYVDEDRGFMRDDYSFLTVGYNKYFYGHAAKFTLDAVMPLNDVDGLDSMTGFSGMGMMSNMEEGEVALRGQFQLLF